MSIKKSPRKWSFLEITNFSDIGTMQYLADSGIYVKKRRKYRGTLGRNIV